MFADAEIGDKPNGDHETSAKRYRCGAKGKLKYLGFEILRG